jgi:negative regulator of flagellin synthesis FlgM
MSMEINGNGGRPPIDPGEAAVGSARNRASDQSSGTANTVSGNSADTFSLTNKASQLQQLEAQIAQAPVVDTQRVLDVQHAISTGTLQVEPARVADKLLQFEAGLNAVASNA